MLRKQTLISTACLLMVAGFVPCDFAKAGEDPLNQAYGHLPTMEEAYGQQRAAEAHDTQQSQSQSNENDKPVVGYSANAPTTYTHQRGGDWTISGPEGNGRIHDQGNITTYTQSRPGGPISTTTCVKLADNRIQCSQH